MENMAFDWQLDEFMVYCRSRQLREKTMNSYEQTLRLFERWCREQMRIEEVDKITESVIRRYINDLQERGKYSFYSDPLQFLSGRASCHRKKSPWRLHSST